MEEARERTLQENTERGFKEFWPSPCSIFSMCLPFHPFRRSHPGRPVYVLRIYVRVHIAACEPSFPIGKRCGYENLVARKNVANILWQE